MNANQETANRLLGQKDYQGALQIYLDLLREHPDDGEIYQWIAKCYLELKKNDEALSAAKEAIKLNKNLSLPHLLLAYIAIDQGHLESAVTEAQEAYNLSPEVDEISTCYGALLLVRGKVDEGIAVLRRTLEPHPDYIVAHQDLVAAYKMKKDYKSYAEEARLVYKQSPSWQNALYLLDAYQRRYAAYLSAIGFSALIGAWLLKLKMLLAIPAFMVIYGLFWDLKFIIDGSWKQKGQLRVLISSLFRDYLLGILTYAVYVILSAK